MSKVFQTQKVSPIFGNSWTVRRFSWAQFIRTVRLRLLGFCSLRSGSGAPCPVGASNVVAVLVIVVFVVSFEGIKGRNCRLQKYFRQLAKNNLDKFFFGSYVTRQQTHPPTPWTHRLHTHPPSVCGCTATLTGASQATTSSPTERGSPRSPLEGSAKRRV